MTMLGAFLEERDLKERWTALFLAPDEPAFITGAVLPVDGGQGG